MLVGSAGVAAGLLGDDAGLWRRSGTCGALGGTAPGAYWIAQAVQHDYGAVHPGLFRRYRAGDWPMGDAGEAHFAAMPDPGLGLPHARIASGDSFVACPDATADLAANLGATLVDRSEEHTSELTSLMRISSAVICLTKKNTQT